MFVLYWLRGRGDRGQVLIIFALIYLSMLIQLIYSIPLRSTCTDVPTSYLKAINKMVKRALDSSLAWKSLGGDFNWYLERAVNNLALNLPIVITILNSTALVREGFCRAEAAFAVSDFKFNSHYILRCLSELNLTILELSRDFPPPSPAFKATSLKVKVVKEYGLPISSLNFTLEYYDGNFWIAIDPIVVLDSTGIWIIRAVIPALASKVRLYVGDWRGIVTYIEFEV